MLKQHKAVALYKLLIKLSSVNIPFRKGYALYQLREELASVFQFQCEQERQLIEKYEAKEIQPGVVACEDPEKNKEFMNAFVELGNVDIVINIRIPLPITLEELTDYCGDTPISMEEIALLKPFLLSDNQNGSDL